MSRSRKGVPPVLVISLLLLMFVIGACAAHAPPPQEGRVLATLSIGSLSTVMDQMAFYRETGRAFLVGSELETDGYGLYSYLLFGSPPSNATRERYLAAISAYLKQIPDITALEESIPRSELNVTYLPVVELPVQLVTAEWVLEHYNYARARILFRALSGTHRDGPYIISCLDALSGTDRLSGKCLYQNMSLVPPHLAELWVDKFLRQAAQGRFWEENTVRNLVVQLRTAVGIFAEGLGEVKEAWVKLNLNVWIAWIN